MASDEKHAPFVLPDRRKDTVDAASAVESLVARSALCDAARAFDAGDTICGREFRDRVRLLFARSCRSYEFRPHRRFCVVRRAFGQRLLWKPDGESRQTRSEEHTPELQSRENL